MNMTLKETIDKIMNGDRRIRESFDMISQLDKFNAQYDPRKVRTYSIPVEDPYFGNCRFTFVSKDETITMSCSDENDVKLFEMIYDNDKHKIKYADMNHKLARTGFSEAGECSAELCKTPYGVFMAIVDHRTRGDNGLCYEIMKTAIDSVPNIVKNYVDEKLGR